MSSKQKTRPLGIGDRLLDHDAQRAAGPDRDRRHARAHGADAEVGQRPVPRADHERDRAVEPELLRRVLRDVEPVRRRHELGELLGRARRRARAPRRASRPSRRSISPVPEAHERSITHSPVRRATTSSLMPAQRSTRAAVSGSSSANQQSLASGAIGCSGVPVAPCRSGCSCFRRSACAVARVSAQVSRSVTGSPSPSRPTSECMAVEHESATTVPSAAAIASRVAASTASTTAFGSWTAWPGSGSRSS